MVSSLCAVQLGVVPLSYRRDLSRPRVNVEPTLSINQFQCASHGGVLTGVSKSVRLGGGSWGKADNGNADVKLS